MNGTIFDIKKYALHDGPGIRTTVFLKGCPLRCVWCHNPESWSTDPEPSGRLNRCVNCGKCIEICPSKAIHLENNLPVTDVEVCDACGSCIEQCPAGAREIIGKKISEEQLISEIKKDELFYDQSQGGVTFSGGEPMMQVDFMAAVLEKCKKYELHTAVDTSCYCKKQDLEKISEIADLFLCDIKHVDPVKHKKFTGVDNKLILDNISQLAETGREIWIRIPLIDGFNFTLDEIMAIGKWASGLNNISKIDILPYNAGGKEKATRLAGKTEIINIKPHNDRLAEECKELLEQEYGFNVSIGG